MHIFKPLAAICGRTARLFPCRAEMQRCAATQDALRYAEEGEHPDILTHLRFLRMSQEEENSRAAAQERAAQAVCYIKSRDAFSALGKIIMSIME
jgi:hypothetical protein